MLTSIHLALLAFGGGKAQTLHRIEFWIVKCLRYWLNLPMYHRKNKIKGIVLGKGPKVSSNRIMSILTELTNVSSKKWYRYRTRHFYSFYDIIQTAFWLARRCWLNYRNVQTAATRSPSYLPCLSKLLQSLDFSSLLDGQITGYVCVCHIGSCVIRVGVLKLFTWYSRTTPAINERLWFFTTHISLVTIIYVWSILLWFLHLGWIPVLYVYIGVLFFMCPPDFITVAENVKVLLVRMVGVNHADGWLIESTSIARWWLRNQLTQMTN